MARKSCNGCGSVRANKHPELTISDSTNRPRRWPAVRALFVAKCALAVSVANFAMGQASATPAPAPQSQAEQQPSTTSKTAPADEQTTAQPSAPNNPAPAQPEPANPPPDAAQPVPSQPSATAFEEVHIQPRKIEDTRPGRLTGERAPADVDPTLKTHTKPIKVDVDLVLIPVTVTDPMNRLVTGLDRDNFVITDAGERQDVRHFSSEDAPLSLGVIFDLSGSMSDKIEKAREAVVEFFKTANPDDEFFMVAFNDKPQVISDFTQSIEKIQGSLIYNIPKGRTALMDGIYLGLAKMREARHQKKALLIISDGGDNHSRYTENEIKSLVKEADVQIYAIGVFSPHPSLPEEMSGPSTLAAITDVTGGRTFTVDNPNELSDVATKIGIELRNQYVLGYRPKNPARDGKWRKIKVKLNAPKGLPPLTVYAKTGYYAPSE